MTPPKGGDARARRLREYRALHYPRMAELWRRGLTFREIVDEVNKDSKDIDDHAWTVHAVRRVLSEGMDRGEYDTRVKEGRTRWSRTRSSRGASRDAPALARAIKLRQSRLTYERIAEVLQDEGYRNSSGVPWTRRYVSAFLHNRVQEAGRAALGIERRRGLSAHQQRKEEFEAEIVPRIVTMWRACLSQRKVVERLNAAGERNFEGQEWNRPHLRDLLKRQLGQAEYAALVRDILGAGGLTRSGRAALGRQSVILGDPGKPVRVLGDDERYRKKTLSKKQRDVVEALLRAGPDGLTNGGLVSATGHGGVRSTVGTLREDPHWAAVIYRLNGTGPWVIGPPQTINTQVGDR